MTDAGQLELGEPVADPQVRSTVRRARMTVAYDGAPFHGFAENDGVETVVGRLREALEKVLRHPVEIVGAGRTDAGVHGWGQVISFDAPAEADLGNVAHRLNRMLGPEIGVREPVWTDDPDFSARFSAEWRHYRYTVLNDPVPNPFLARTAWHVHQPLALDRMNLACDPLIGEHDFSSFCRRPAARPGFEPPTMVRKVLRAHWSVPDPQGAPTVLRFDIRATAFCHQMVRSIVGTLVEVGLHRRSPGEMMATLHARSRTQAGQIAPPQGLCLWEVGY